MTRGVIFDLDGVLVSTDELHYRAWQSLAQQEGIDFDRRTNDRLRGVSRMESLHIILEQAPRTYSRQQRLSLADRKNETYRALLEGIGPADVMAGARELLAALTERGISVAVASSSRNARLILERIELLDRFDAVVDGNDVTRAKPHPEGFLTAAHRLGCRPEECLVFEDAAAGIEAARRAGMRVFGIGTPQRLPGVRPLAAGLAEVTVEQVLNAGEGTLS